ncbi:MAG: hypothetical protein AAF652_20525 [Cyanobacteria bacterium P01_C01_bin.72]
MKSRLSAKSRANITRLLTMETKMLGEILQEADLVSSWQIEAALQDKLQYPHLKLGEILAQKELVKLTTADFFVQDWTKAVMESKKNVLGYYLQQAAILDSEQIEFILAQQKISGVRFGTVAVLQGFLKSTTLDFFLANLFPEELGVSPFINMRRGASLF